MGKVLDTIYTIDTYIFTTRYKIYSTFSKSDFFFLQMFKIKYTRYANIYDIIMNEISYVPHEKCQNVKYFNTFTVHQLHQKGHNDYCKNKLFKNICVAV